MKKDGAIEYGASNSSWLAIAHVLFYIAAITEWFIRKPPVDGLSILGIALYVMSAMALVGVISNLCRLWTVELLIARDHVLVQRSLFGVVRHPNCF
ncbi:isoprenylcysteine carboxylmethyltransferase family protein [Acidisarcina polymorpha]|uniref:isoprenylcysteine carboxylmethyltransferase family protein n=1 Tax=Acidisarcina polymorpha TaxID=2211140 RepID=UPI0039C894FE